MIIVRTDMPSVATFADHEVITPPNKLRKAVARTQKADDPVARAEQALAELSTQFDAWMQIECERLDSARQRMRSAGVDKQSREALFHAAHDIKGEAATFGYPAVAAAADSLCRLLEHAPDATRIPFALIDQHVDAVRAIIREYARSDAAEIAAILTQRLREVTDEFLLQEHNGCADQRN
jgi:HPt (histidine-containing phosphotransfer) domain-containing protein